MKTLSINELASIHGGISLYGIPLIENYCPVYETENSIVWDQMPGNRIHYCENGLSPEEFAKKLQAETNKPIMIVC